MYGKKLYKTGMLNIFRLVILAIVIFFLNDFVLNTYTYENFQAVGRFKILDVLEYHLTYPREFITFFCLIFIPAIYYSFIRGTRFFEKGFSYNMGLPFMNKFVPYSEVKIYKLLHPEHVVTIHTEKGEVFIIADNALERVIAILDQHNIQGDLARDDYSKLITNFKKFVVVLVAFIFVVFFIKKLGFFPR